MKYRRILLKLSGEALMGDKQFGIDNNRLMQYANDIKEISQMDVEIGIVIGGGLALIRASQNCYRTGKGDEKLGAEIVFDAIQEPFKQIIRNGGGQPEVILNKILEGSNKHAGYDSRKEIIVNMIDEGIIDPAKVVRVALENAASVAGMILTTDCALIMIKEKDNPFINM